MNAAIINAVRNATLFAADKYRKATDLLERFDDALTADTENAESEFRRVAELSSEVEAFSTDDKALTVKALHAYADDLNRKQQALSDRYQTEAASLIATRVREVYQALDFVRTGQSESAAQTESGEA